MIRRVCKVLSCLFLLGMAQCDSDVRHPAIDKARELTRGNRCIFFKGIGYINDQYHLYYEEKGNVIYGSKNAMPYIAYKDERVDLDHVRLVQITMKDGDDIIEEVDDIIDHPAHLYVIFSPKYIYILDFSTREYAEYKRRAD